MHLDHELLRISYLWNLLYLARPFSAPLPKVNIMDDLALLLLEELIAKEKLDGIFVIPPSAVKVRLGARDFLTYRRLSVKQSQA